MFEDRPDEHIPDDWTSDQALAIVNFLELMAEVIWSRYGPAIARECLTPAQVTTGRPLQLRLPY